MQFDKKLEKINAFSMFGMSATATKSDAMSLSFDDDDSF